MKRKIVIGIVILALIISGIVFFINRNQPNQVIGYMISTGEYEELVSAIGYVEYEDESSVQVEVNGKIKNMLVDEGDLISRGEVIVQIDDADARTLYEDLEGNLALAQSRYSDYSTNYSVSSRNTQEQRQTKKIEIEGYRLSLAQLDMDINKMKELYNEGVIAKAELEKLQNEREIIENNIKVAQASLDAMNNPAFASKELMAAIDVAKKNLDQQEQELEKYEVYSPYNAIVLEKYVDTGDLVQPSQEIVKLASVDNKVIWVDIDERYIGTVEIGQKAILTAEAYPNKQYNGQIIGFSPTIDRQTGTISVKVKISQDSEVFIGNMSVKVDVTTVEYNEVVLIPGDYIYDKDQMTVLMADDEGMVYTKSIRVENLNKQMLHVLEGLEAGEVIIHPTDSNPGERVEIEETVTDIEKRDEE